MLAVSSAAGRQAVQDPEVQPVSPRITVPSRAADFTLLERGEVKGQVWVERGSDVPFFFTERRSGEGLRRTQESRCPVDEVGRPTSTLLLVEDQKVLRLEAEIDAVTLRTRRVLGPDGKSAWLKQRDLHRRMAAENPEIEPYTPEEEARLRPLYDPTREHLVGWSPVALITDDHRVALFDAADLVPRLEGEHRSFQVQWLDDEDSSPQRWAVRYAGLQEVSLAGSEEPLSLFAFEMTGGEHDVRVHLDRHGVWARLEVGKGLYVLEPGASRRALLRAVERSPAPPVPGREDEVEVPVEDEVSLAGVLRWPGRSAAISDPDTAPPPLLPAVLLLGGTGALDRDGNGPEGRPPRGSLLRELARALTRSGFVTLCLDDRGVGTSGGTINTAGLYRQNEDAAHAFRFLAGQSGVDPERVAVLGHSEGALIAALVHRHVKPCASILMAPVTRPLHDLLPSQSQVILRLQGMPEARVQRLVDLQTAFFDWLGSHGPHETIPDEFSPIASMGGRDWWQDHLDLDPMQPLAALRGPVLILHGSQDRNVDAEQSAELLSLLTAAGSPVHRQVFYGLDHFFMASANGDPMRSLEEGRRVNPRVLDVLVQWATWNL